MCLTHMVSGLLCSSCRELCITSCFGGIIIYGHVFHMACSEGCLPACSVRDAACKKNERRWSENACIRPQIRGSESVPSAYAITQDRGPKCDPQNGITFCLGLNVPQLIFLAFSQLQNLRRLCDHVNVL